MVDVTYSYSDPRIVALKSIRASFAVEVLLVERLEKYGVNPFKAYLSILNDEYEVGASRTLFDEVLDHVEREELPNYVMPSDVFSRQFSFAEKDRVKSLSLDSFEKISMSIVRVLTLAPSVNRSNRAVRSLSFEEVHGVLKYKFPDVNINEVYVTSFAEGVAGRDVFQSRRLAEDVYYHLQHDQIPHYHGEHIGIYSVAHSSEEAHLHEQLNVSDIKNMVIEVVPGFMA